MILYPAIDVLDGRVVRLARGDFNAVTDYGGDPLAAAQAWRTAGAQWLHLVDLSGARDATRRQTGLVEAVAGAGLKIQTGGGVRTREDIAALLDAGAARVVVGSLAISEPRTVIGWLKAFGPERLAAAFDVKLEDGVAWPVVRGWTQRSDQTLDALLEAYREAGLIHALVTDVARDGMLEGPNKALYDNLIAARPDIAWQASGGVASLDDLRALKAAGLSGAIMGRALFEGRIDLAEALAC
ncbi:1-(5-phosphoribosyl)-5-[(5-phosphoribosylamino)methylideneamino] imidazole-4-carboxamide isomerase [Alkalicaulis satelles]|uniref:1-(5-phosphoribosyl)-5-[(5-phosphoribosylamino)methylideneamino] imidazole-4-carboxamide isomerase n=1 Tax=Alkalicaulis satelles TaxID=2609175 RepID=A0A5M6ZLE0_9PROT|nr:1-(5-phosphoribosyl)-5-[(5-phosphoribosylamino)methylideneamino] imidazole-4-carboxamide isomerase [Alkalicaulis satelles]KAA5804765.1 1-(5-phosphoribosyl)-5-[(5-phosphoribosylamino)methylideneamino] imidazole-4-carboxamide isomerase [Alkalicaulis satelles]